MSGQSHAEPAGPVDRSSATSSIVDSQVARAADEFLACLARGDLPDTAEYVARFPELAPLFMQVLPALAEMRPDAKAGEPGSPLNDRPPDGMLGKYRIEREIGRGGMGVVYEVVHVDMDQRRALKVLPPGFNRSVNAFERFRREVKAAARLDHPHIVRAYDAACEGEFPYLVMEYVDGTDLGTLVRQRGPLPVNEALDYLLQAARGLEYAHAQGVVHRDVKPSNLLVDRQGRLRVSDMGLARLSVAPINDSADTAPQDGITQSGQVVGSLDYMAPEQADNSRAVDQRADIYSLGCTLFRLLTGDAPYGGSLVQRLLAHQFMPVPSLIERRPDIPSQLEAVYQRMVAKQPDDRFASMSEVVAALETLTSGDAVAAAELPRAAPRPSVVSSPKSLRWAGAVPVMLAALGAVWWWFPQSATDPAVATPTVAGPAGPVQTEAPPTDTWSPDLLAAEWVLSLGGRVGVQTDDVELLLIDKRANLPAAPFRLVQIRLEDQHAVTDDQLQRITGLQHLQTLYLSSPFVTDQGLAHLRDLPQLTDVSLRGTSVGDLGAEQLARLPSIASLSLYRTRITDFGCLHLARMPGLKKLAVSGTRVGDAGVRHLAAIPELEVLQLANTLISDEALAAIDRLTSITTMNLEGTAITDTGLAHLESHDTLERLYLAGTRVTPEGIARFRTAVPNCRIASQ